MKNDQWVNFLFEHKSEPDKKTYKQLLNYILESWDLHEQQEPSYELLPVVISIIVYHGKKSWKIENSIKPLIAIIEETQDCVPDFKAFLLDLSAFDLEIIADSMLKMFLLTLKYGKNANLFSILPQIISISEKIDHNGRSDDYLRVVLTYLGAIINSDEKDKFWKIVAEEHRDGEEFMETIADALRKEERLKREKIEREAAILREKIIQKNTELKQMETELKLMETEIKQMEIEIERKELEIERKELEIEQKETKLEQKGKEIEQKDAALHKIVQKMLRRNMGIQDIQEITGLSYRAIQQIKSGTEKDPEN